MRIGIDASRAITRQRTGTEAYAYHLISALMAPAADAHHQIELYFNQAPPAGLFPEQAHVRQIELPFPRLWTHVRLAFYLQCHQPDVFFTPAHVIPLSYFGPSVATVHDLGYDRFPEAHTRGQVAYLRWSTKHNSRRGRRIAVDSRATKADLMRRYQVAPEKIKVIYPGVNPELAPERDPFRLKEVQVKYGLTSPYLLYIGTLQPRKNLVRLVQAFASGDFPHQLVLAGRRGWLAQSITDEIARQPAEVRARIHLPGYVDEEDKGALLTGATALLFPSLYEGFGFPVLEAQACAVPVICADNSSLPEVAGDAALLVNAEDTGALCRAIQQVIEDPQLRARLSEAGQRNVRRFSWRAAGEQMLALLEQAAEES